MRVARQSHYWIAKHIEESGLPVPDRIIFKESLPFIPAGVYEVDEFGVWCWKGRVPPLNPNMEWHDVPENQQ